MGNQLLLVLLLVTFVVTWTESTPSTGHNSIHDDDNKVNNDLPRGLNPKYNKMLPNPPGLEKLKPTVNTAPPTSEKKETTKLPLAEDFRYNKMLPEVNSVMKDGSASTSKEDDDDYYDMNYDYDDEYDDDLSASNKTTVPAVKATSEETLKPIKGDDKDEPKKNKNSQNTDSSDDEDESIDDIEDEEEILFNENVPCPRDCICERNVNSYLVATCSRLDADVQKFGSDITDLVVVDIGPKYPILLGPEFFSKIGLKHVSSIKISNCTIEYIHPTAFHGLQELYSVNLTNVRLTSINPDTFAQNKRLRLLTISGNDFSEISRKDVPNSHYLLKSDSIEELDLSNNNLKQLLPTAFTQLSSIVYVSLAQNSLKTLPEKLFHSVESIEELDLSHNSIVSLPENIFNRTALAILHLKYNDVTGDLKFGTVDLQQLDLSFCSIKEVNYQTFSKMGGLTNLNLKGNGLTKIQPEAFQSQRNLRFIDLSINDLDQVSSHQFFKNSELDVIRLNDNPRLTQLPPDGFQSYTGEFNVYLFDISNCAIGPLGHKTFSTMPHLTTLKLAWNNINNLEKGTFIYLEKLTELDLSNNLVVKLDDLLFLRNPQLSKLNLAGNPIRKLSTKLFQPLNNLKELDVSECELHTLLADNYYGVNSRIKLYESLQYFNASLNQIRKVSKDDIRHFRDLKTLDISNNPLKCNEEFKELIKYLGRKNIASGRIPTNMPLDDSFAYSIRSAQTWDSLARTTCKRASDTFKPLQEVTSTEKVMRPQEIDKKVLSEAKEDIEEDTSLGEDADDSDEQIEDDDDGEYGYDDDDDEEEDTETKKDEPIIKDKGLFAEEINSIKEIEDKFLRGKLSNSDGDGIVIEREKFYYSSYKFVWPMLIIIFGVVIILLVIAKIVSLLMRKRGERYRQAILASKNSIVYQKLSEDISPKTPKVHRYARINQV